jgi:hypothetical protein
MKNAASLLMPGFKQAIGKIPHSAKRSAESLFATYLFVD